MVALVLTEDQVMVEVPVLAEMTEVPGLVEIQEETDQENRLPQPVLTVEMNVNYHSSQETRDLFIVENVSKITNHKKAVVALDSTEDQVMVEMTEDQVMVEMTEDQVMVEMREIQDTIEVHLDSNETVLQFTIEIILDQKEIN